MTFDCNFSFSDAEVSGFLNGSLDQRNTVQFATPLSSELSGDGLEQTVFAEVDAKIDAGGKEDYENAYETLRKHSNLVSIHISVL